jgi:ABC-type transport system substrate-binding protein
MKNKLLLVVLVAGLLTASAACSSSAPANANATKTTNTTTTTTTTTNTANTSAPANTNTSTASNTNATSNSGSTAQQGGAQDFTLVNQTGVEIDKLYIGPHNVDEWGEDILGQDTLPSGQSVEIKFSRTEKAAMWDLKIEDKQGNSIEWENLNLLEINKVTLFYKDGKGTAQVE